ncbi:low molecular weight phosphatase family protein [Candidatus Kaiserbacteria bacterium]|nr:low molecular weight phosphatase family protein [Candidatus Kaiserbacteria bacterium]
MKNVLIVCWGNIYRSVVAEELLRKVLIDRNMQDRYRIESRGIQGAMGVPPAEHANLRGYPETYAQTRKILEAYSISISEHKVSTPISREDAERADVILVLGEEALNKLQAEWQEAPAITQKMRLLSSVADPHNQKDADYLQNVVTQIAEDIHRFAKTEFSQ